VALHLTGEEKAKEAVGHYGEALPATTRKGRVRWARQKRRPERKEKKNVWRHSPEKSDVDRALPPVKEWV